MADERSLSEVHASVPIPEAPGFLRRLAAFAGPAYLVSVGYMDPGNWATDIAAGSRYGYALIWVLVVSNAMAILLQSLSARLGLVAGKDLAQASRQWYPPAINFVLWILCEIAIAACDLAEVVGAAIGLNLLFGIPLLWGVVITALDTILLLFLHQKGIRKMEAFIVVLVATIGGCFLAEILISQPDPAAIMTGFLPTLPDDAAIYFAAGIVGATVMPHNLYLHSALVQSRRVTKTAQGINQSLKFNLIDSVVALNLAFFVNAAILIMAAAVFHQTGHEGVADIEEAHQLLAPIVGGTLAPALFAIALIAAGQSSTITGTLAGQIVMEGYIDVRLQPWLRRLVTRAIAVVPVVVTIVWFGEESTGALLVLSQVVLSLQLSFAVVPLIHMVSDRRMMGAFALKTLPKLMAWVTAGLIMALNVKLVADEMGGWLAGGGTAATVTAWVALPVAGAAGLLLVYVIVEPLVLRRFRRLATASIHTDRGAPHDIEPAKAFRRIAAALDFGPRDEAILARAAALAAESDQPLLLFHVVESATARALGRETEDRESRQDLERLRGYALALGKYDVPVECALGYGDPVRAIPQLVDEHGVELLVLGGHGHRGLADLLYGSTIDGVRHRTSVALLVVGREDPAS